MKNVIVSMMTATLLFGAAAAQADEGECLYARYKALAKYRSCNVKATLHFLFVSTAKGLSSFESCRTKYVGTWDKIRDENPATSCDTARYVDNLDGTVTDHLSGLVWEKKTNQDGVVNPSDRHDSDNTYAWTNGDADPIDEDGAAFTDFLADLNSASGLGGANGWRLPTLEELQTILVPGICATPPCIDPALGPDHSSWYWTASTEARDPIFASIIDTSNSPGGAGGVEKPTSLSVRAVRGGY